MRISPGAVVRQPFNVRRLAEMLNINGMGPASLEPLSNELWELYAVIMELTTGGAVADRRPCLYLCQHNTTFFENCQASVVPASTSRYVCWTESPTWAETNNEPNGGFTRINYMPTFFLDGSNGPTFIEVILVNGQAVDLWSAYAVGRRYTV